MLMGTGLTMLLKNMLPSSLSCCACTRAAAQPQLFSAGVVLAQNQGQHPSPQAVHVQDGVLAQVALRKHRELQGHLAAAGLLPEHAAKFLQSGSGLPSQGFYYGMFWDTCEQTAC